MCKQNSAKIMDSLFWSQISKFGIKYVSILFVKANVKSCFSLIYTNKFLFHECSLNRNLELNFPMALNILPLNLTQHIIITTRIKL